MDLTIDQTSFARALRLAGRSALKKSSLPILQSILLQGEFGRLTLPATDVELGVSTTLEMGTFPPSRRWES